jgi:hypothetical protein
VLLEHIYTEHSAQRSRPLKADRPHYILAQNPPLFSSARFTARHETQAGALCGAFKNARWMRIGQHAELKQLLPGWSVLTSPDTVNVPENTTAVMTVTATDADLPPQSLTFSIIGGADQARFGITSGGALSFNSAPDFEAPNDTNGDNIYVVIVQTSDGSLTDIQAILVTVTNGNDGLTGDYNLDRSVNAADYVVWRKTLGMSGLTPFSGADGSGNGSVGPEDFDIWKMHFGNTLPPPATGGGAGALALADPVDVSEAFVVAPAVKTATPAGVNAFAIQADPLAMPQVHSWRIDLASPRERLNLGKAAVSDGDQLLRLLALDRVGRSSRHDFSVFDDHGSENQSDDDLVRQSLADETLAVALAEWR